MTCPSSPKRRLLFTLLLCAGFAGPPLAVRAESQGDQITRPYLDGTVRVSVPGQAEGFGFIVGERAGELYLLTAEHVVKQNAPGQKPRVQVYFHQDQAKPVSAEVLAREPHLDAALLRAAKPARIRWQPQAYCLPPFERGERVWFIGRDRRWDVPLDAEAGYLRRVEPDYRGRIEFSSVGVKRGTSGAPLIGTSGILGMVIQDEVNSATAVAIDTLRRFVRYPNSYPWALAKCGTTPAPIASAPIEPAPAAPAPTAPAREFSTGAYKNNASMSEELSIPGAEALQITLNGESEKGYDLLRVYYDGLSKHKDFSGPYRAHQFVVPGDHIKVTFNADGRTTKAGLSLSIQAAPRSAIPAAPAPTPAAPAHGDTWTEPNTGLEFVYLQGDCFQMGSPDGEAGRDSDEKRHRVCVDGFWLAKTEVSNAQYRRFKPAHDSGEYKDHSLNGDAQPAVKVSWQDAVAFTEWLNQRAQGRFEFRLPTEAEWEYAARGEATTARFWGDDPAWACRYANVADQSAKKQWNDWTIHDCDDGFAVTAPVGRFQANGFGLFDMLGNVWEWTCSEYDEGYGGEEKQCSSKNHANGRRVLRGGSWNDGPARVRSADRILITPGRRFGELGFRPARIK